MSGKKKVRSSSVTESSSTKTKKKEPKVQRSGSVSGTEATRSKKKKGTAKLKADQKSSGIDVKAFSTTKITDSTDTVHTIKLDELLTGLDAVGAELFTSEDEAVQIAKQQTDAGSIVQKALRTKAVLKVQTKEKSVSEALIKPFDVLFSKSSYADYVRHRDHITNKFVFDMAWEMIEQLSNLAIYPFVINEMPKLAKMPVAKKDLFKDNALLFTFALRNILARVAFQTVLSKAVFDALRDKIEGPNSAYEWKSPNKSLPWSDSIAFVGFNRLLSPKNSIGVSISSDIDFKLVFDPSQVVQKGSKEAITDMHTAELVKLLNSALKEWMPAFDEARLTLEVEDFTTKDLSSVARVLASQEAERNFYASMINNNICIAGSKLVYAKFTSTVQTYIDDPANNFIIAKRTHLQYLSESDKGSILVIKYVKKLKDLVEACGPTLCRYLDSWSGQDALKLFCKITHHTEHEWHSKTDKKKEGWVTSLRVFYKLVTSAKMKLSSLPDGEMKLVELLIQEKPVKKALNTLEGANVFPSLHGDHQALLKRAAKLLKTLADDEILSFEGRHLIGYHPYSPDVARITYQLVGSKVATESSWRFNIKYVGCRLSDFFDAVTLKNFKTWWGAGNDVTATAAYAVAKKVAVAINKFALALQSTIYLAAIYRLQPDLPRNNEPPPPKAVGASHVTIDNLYSRISRNEFLEIVVMSAKDPSDGVGGLVDIRPSLLDLAKDLKACKGDCNPTMKPAATKAIKKAEALKGVIDSLGTTDAPDDGKPFFDSVFELASATANSLLPPPPSV